MSKLMKVCLFICALLSLSLGQAHGAEAPSDKVEYTVKSGDWLAKISRKMFHTDDYVAVAQFNNIKDPNVIHPGMVLRYAVTAKVAVKSEATKVVTPRTEVRAAKESCTQKEEPDQVGIASWYGYPYHGRTASSGEVYDMNAYTVAHRTLPLGTKVCVTSARNGKSVVARVNDRGPFIEPRILDVSKRIAEDLDLILPGTGMVRISIITMPQKGMWHARRDQRDEEKDAKLHLANQVAPKDTVQRLPGSYPGELSHAVVSANGGSTDPPHGSNAPISHSLILGDENPLYPIVKRRLEEILGTAHDGGDLARRVADHIAFNRQAAGCGLCEDLP